MEGVQLKATKEERDLRVYLQSDLKPSKQCIESVKKSVQGMRCLSYEERLERTGLTTLEVRRARGDLIEVFKTLKKFEDIELKSLFKLADTAYNTRGHSLKLAKYRRRLDIRKYFFSQRVIKLWNSLPPPRGMR